MADDADAEKEINWLLADADQKAHEIVQVQRRTPKSWLRHYWNEKFSRTGR